MIKLFFDVTLKILRELLIGIGVVAAFTVVALFTLWIWNKINPESFDRFLAKLARYFK